MLEYLMMIEVFVGIVLNDTVKYRNVAKVRLITNKEDQLNN
jgi:hypothetical protein